MGFDDNNAVQQEEQKASVHWKNLSEDKIKSELNKTGARLERLAKMLAEIQVAEGDYDAAEKLRKELTTDDLTYAGWLCTFISENEDAFPDSLLGFKSKEYYTMSEQDRQTYDMVSKYLDDAKALKPTFSLLVELLAHMAKKDALKNCAKLMLAKANFDDAGYEGALYIRIISDLKAVSVLINQDWDALEPKAKKSEDFFLQIAKEYEGKEMDEKKYKELSGIYKRKRLEDYDEIIRNCPFFDSLLPQGNGVYCVKDEVLARMMIIDSYTKEIAQMKGLKESLERTVEICEVLLREYISGNEEACKMPASQNLVRSFQFSIDMIQEFAGKCGKTFESFHDGIAEAPYIFMSELPEVHGDYTFNSINSLPDPASEGSRYWYMYNVLEHVVNEHCKEFVNNHGELAD